MAFAPIDVDEVAAANPHVSADLLRELAEWSATLPPAPSVGAEYALEAALGPGALTTTGPSFISHNGPIFAP